MQTQLLLRRLGAGVMLSVLSTLIHGKQPTDYPHLHENRAASAKLEVRKVLHGQVDGMFVVPRTQQVVAAAGGYLWKFSPQGELLDTLREPENLFTSGMAFTPEHYIDWVFTGQAQPKAYGPAVDGNTLSRAEVLAALQKADVVEFGKEDNAAWAYLWAGGRAWKMDLARHREAVDTWCKQRTHSAEALGWDATCFDGLDKAPRAWSEVEPESFGNQNSNDNSPQRVEVTGFDRRKYHLEEGLSGQLFGFTVGAALKAMGMPGSLPGRYWFGDAHTRLRVGEEVLQFKAFVPYVRGDYKFWQNMNWWEPARQMPGASPWFSVHMRGYMNHHGEEGLLKYYEKDIGLYVVRPRGSGVAAGAQGQAVPAWRPVFAGPATGRVAVSGTVEFATAAPAHVWLRSPAERKRMPDMPPVVPVHALWPTLRHLPQALTVQWRAPAADDSEPVAVLRITLDPAEMKAAFERLPAAKTPLELVVQVPTLHSPAHDVQVLLRSGTTQTVLAQARAGEAMPTPFGKTRVAYTVAPPPPPKPARAAEPYVPPAHLPLLESLQAQAEKAQRDPAKQLQPLLAQATTLAQHPQHAQALAPGVTAVVADLLNRFNMGGKLEASATLVRHYLAQVHPHTSRWPGDSSLAYNQGVIASQTLAFGIHSAPNRDLVDGVMGTLIGPHFDPAKQTNGTLMYNLACYYAVSGDKPNMLQSASAARRLGKPASQFLTDTDFEKYWKDIAFLQVLTAQP